MSYIHKFVNWVYSREGYNFFKSGLSIDYYFKKFTYNLWKQFSVFIGVIFLEKFVIEYLTKKLTEGLLFMQTNFANTQKKYSHYQLKLILLVVLVVLSFIFFVLL